MRSRTEIPAWDDLAVEVSTVSEFGGEPVVHVRFGDPDTSSATIFGTTSQLRSFAWKLIDAAHHADEQHST
jgi:hypothetical protein